MKIETKKWWNVAGVFLILILPGVLLAQHVKYPNDADTMRTLSERVGKMMLLKEAKNNILVKNRNGQPVDYNLPKAQQRNLKSSKIFDSNKKSVLRLCMSYKCNYCNDNHISTNATAFVLTEDGLAATNYHVLESFIDPASEKSGQADSAMRDVRMFFLSYDNHIYTIKDILTYNKANDIAIFRLETNGEKLKPVSLGKEAEVGSEVFVISHPMGNPYYFSKGVVARNHELNIDNSGTKGMRMDITADYAKGSSGGPIFDEQGNVAGMVSSTYTITYKDDLSAPQDVQMVIKRAVPVAVLKELINTKK